MAGMVDSASAAGATFFAGVIAVRELQTASLALYALLFSSSVLAMVIPRQLQYVPAELGANVQEGRRAPLVATAARRAVPANLVALAVVVVSGLPVLGQIEPAAFLGLVLTAAGFSVVAPLRDHVRSSLHLVERHWSAAICSLVVLGFTGAAALGSLAVPRADVAPLLPFGSLLIGSTAAIVVGVRLLRGSSRHTGYRPHTFRVRSRFLFAEVAVQAAWFGCNTAVLLLVSARALSDLEAARVLASPLNIVTTGLLTFMGPSLLRTVSSGGSRASRRGIRQVLAAILGVGALYAVALIVFAGPVQAVVDRPVDLGLVATRLVSVVLEGFSGVLLYLAFGLGRSGASLVASVTAGAIGLVGTVLLAPLLREFALPVGQSIGMAVRVVLGLRIVQRGTTAPAGTIRRTT